MTTVKIILMCPGLLMYDPEIITQLSGFTLADFTELGQVLANCGAFRIERRNCKRLEEHIGFLEDPGIDARYKGLLDF